MLRGKSRYEPGSSSAKWLFRLAAIQAGVPSAWASNEALHAVMKNESDGWVGRPNYTYGAVASTSKSMFWPAVWNELKQGIRSTKSSATGLGQLILENVDKYYPSGARGIGVPVEEAVGFMRYIKDRYGSPEAALAYGMRGGSWGGY